MQCPTCGFHTLEYLSFDETIGAAENAITVHGLKGHVCPSCGDAVLDKASYDRLTSVQASWVKQQKENEVQRLRKQLNLTQIELAEALGIGALAVSRYERGVSTPKGIYLKVMRVVAKHPELIAEFRAA
jgi:HTH-type transcriptional regulator / antitoxin MqsA